MIQELGNLKKLAKLAMITRKMFSNGNTDQEPNTKRGVFRKHHQK